MTVHQEPYIDHYKSEIVRLRKEAKDNNRRMKRGTVPAFWNFMSGVQSGSCAELSVTCLKYATLRAEWNFEDRKRMVVEFIGSRKVWHLYQDDVGAYCGTDLDMINVLKRFNQSVRHGIFS